MVSELCPDDLKTIYPEPTARVIAKARPAIDVHAQKFIEMSPFCVLATSGSDGSVDASPRGGHPGFIRVDGPNRLLMPDRPGNNRQFQKHRRWHRPLATGLLRARARRDAARRRQGLSDGRP
jgi:hypothetical protein